jgi:RNA recognition motif-containing protein
LSYNTIEDYLEGLFSEVCQVTEVSVPYDRITGRFQEFAFVELTNEGAVVEAIQRFDGYEFRG